ncbi:MAG: RidA family protein [Methylococcales bacterium]|nr:RidA family protein [Methylococcales bacterium]
MNKTTIKTNQAPQAIGTYSQAIKVNETVYLSGQIPLDPKTMELVEGDISVHIRQVFDNLSAVAKASGGQLADIVKLNVYLTNLADFSIVNKVMTEYFEAPYPARAVVGVSALPKGVAIEMDAIMIIDDESYHY